MSTRTQRRGGGGVVGAIRADVERLHGAWMELVFPRQRGRGHSVIGKWKPETLPQTIGYHGWSLLGLFGLLLLYPLAVIGLATRYYAAKLDSTRTRLGIVGATGLALVGWGLLTVAWGAMSYMERADSCSRRSSRSRRRAPSRRCRSRSSRRAPRRAAAR